MAETQAHSGDSAPVVYTINEAAKILKLSSPTIYRLMDAGKIRYAKIGARRLIPQSELSKIIADSMVA